MVIMIHCNHHSCGQSPHYWPAARPRGAARGTKRGRRHPAILPMGSNRAALVTWPDVWLEVTALPPCLGEISEPAPADPPAEKPHSLPQQTLQIRSLHNLPQRALQTSSPTACPSGPSRRAAPQPAPAGPPDKKPPQAAPAGPPDKEPPQPAPAGPPDEEPPQPVPNGPTDKGPPPAATAS